MFNDKALKLLLLQHDPPSLSLILNKNQSKTSEVEDTIITKPTKVLIGEGKRRKKEAKRKIRKK